MSDLIRAQSGCACFFADEDGQVPSSFAFCGLVCGPALPGIAMPGVDAA